MGRICNTTKRLRRTRHLNDAGPAAAEAVPRSRLCRAALVVLLLLIWSLQLCLGASLAYIADGKKDVYGWKLARPLGDGTGYKVFLGYQCCSMTIYFASLLWYGFTFANHARLQSCLFVTAIFVIPRSIFGVNFVRKRSRRQEGFVLWRLLDTSPTNTGAGLLIAKVLVAQYVLHLSLALLASLQSAAEEEERRSEKVVRTDSAAGANVAAGASGADMGRATAAFSALENAGDAWSSSEEEESEAEVEEKPVVEKAKSST